MNLQRPLQPTTSLVQALKAMTSQTQDSGRPESARESSMMMENHQDLQVASVPFAHLMAEQDMASTLSALLQPSLLTSLGFSSASLSSMGSLSSNTHPVLLGIPIPTLSGKPLNPDSILSPGINAPAPKVSTKHRRTRTGSTDRFTAHSNDDNQTNGLHHDGSPRSPPPARATKPSALSPGVSLAETLRQGLVRNASSRNTSMDFTLLGHTPAAEPLPPVVNQRSNVGGIKPPASLSPPPIGAAVVSGQFQQQQPAVLTAPGGMVPLNALTGGVGTTDDDAFRVENDRKERGEVAEEGFVGDVREFMDLDDADEGGMLLGGGGNGLKRFGSADLAEMYKSLCQEEEVDDWSLLDDLNHATTTSNDSHHTATAIYGGRPLNSNTPIHISPPVVVPCPPPYGFTAASLSPQEHHHQNVFTATSPRQKPQQQQPPVAVETNHALLRRGSSKDGTSKTPLQRAASFEPTTPEQKAKNRHGVTSLKVKIGKVKKPTTKKRRNSRKSSHAGGSRHSKGWTTQHQQDNVKQVFTTFHLPSNDEADINNTTLVPVECELLFTKYLTPSDTTRGLGRIILPRVAAEVHMPACTNKDGTPVTIIDMNGTSFVLMLKYWHNGRPIPKKMYLLDNCKPLIDAHDLVQGDALDFYISPDGRYVVDARKCDR